MVRWAVCGPSHAQRAVRRVGSSGGCGCRGRSAVPRVRRSPWGCQPRGRVRHAAVPMSAIGRSRGWISTVTPTRGTMKPSSCARFTSQGDFWGVAMEANAALAGAAFTCRRNFPTVVTRRTNAQLKATLFVCVDRLSTHMDSHSTPTFPGDFPDPRIFPGAVRCGSLPLVAPRCLVPPCDLAPPRPAGHEDDAAQGRRRQA